MKLFKPSWVSHNGQPVFCIDIHPDGSRFATGGQGDGGSSGKVVVWNMTPVCNAEHEMNKDIPKVLCVMENHLACVNCVRWSCNGRYLASGGDDRLIMIWQFAGYGAAGVFGGSSNFKTSSGERWRCSHTLKGHTGDVLDLAWSPANQWLASCSIDNTVVIWNVEKFPEIATVLKGHSSLVKGVTWDPVGSYVASQSDDKTVKIWKTIDWKLETTITKPFQECTATTHVLRLSWSPDGGYLVSAHAMNNSGPTAQIIERTGWKTEMDFVGHRKAITCTRFNGCVFSKSKSSSDDKSKTLPYTCCAVGSRDRSLSIWLTSLRRPLVVIHDLFENSIMDVTWSFSGYFLLCCSWDGTVAYVQFTQEEIGQTLSQEEKNKLHKDTYGKSSALVSQPLVIENPAMLAMQEKKNEFAAGNGLPKEPTAPLVYPTKQIETRTKTGKRRIIPVFVAPQEALGGVPRPFGSSTTFGKIGSSLLKSSDQIGADSSSRADVSPAKSNSAVEASVAEQAKSSIEKAIAPPETGDKVAGTAATVREKKGTTENGAESSLKQIDTARDLKKAVLDIRLCEKTKVTSENNKTNEEKKDKLIEKPAQVTPAKDPPRPPTSVASSGDEEPLSTMPRRVGRPPLSLKRKQGETSSPAKKKHKQIRKEHTRMSQASRMSPHKNVAPVSSIEKEATSAVKAPSHLVKNAIAILPTPKLVRKISIQSPANSESSIITENELNSDNKPVAGALHKISCVGDEQQLWFTVLSSPVNLLRASKFLVCCSCLDHTIHVYSITSGRRLLPPLCFGSVGSAAARLHCRGHHVMAVDSTCNMTVWDTKNSKVLVDHRSFLHLLPETTKDKPLDLLHQCSLTERGFPVISLHNGKSYTFNVDLSSWMVVGSAHSAVEHFAENVVSTTLNDASMTSHEKEIFSVLNKKLHNGTGAHAARAFHASPAVQRNATLALLEQKVASSLALQSLSEYRKWLLAYVRYLVQEKLELRLREVCDDLIGPPNLRHGHVSSKPSLWKPHIMGMHKRTLLQRDILPVIGSNLSFQRLYTEYQDQLNDVDNKQRPSWKNNS